MSSKERPLRGLDVADGRHQALHLAAPVQQVGGDGQVPLAGQPVGLAAQVVGHPEGVVDDDHARPRARALGGGEVGGQLARGGRHRHVGHVVLRSSPPSGRGRQP